MSTLAERIKKFEGYYDKPYWDHKQWSVGYGSRASGPNDVVDQAEAERRLARELAPAEAIVDRYAPGLPPGVRDSLVSLTYNAGDAWTRAGLGQAIKAGDMDRARELFLQYTKASGQELPGLVKRRQEEVSWWGQPATTSPQPATDSPAAAAVPATPAANPSAPAAGGAPSGLLSPILGNLGVPPPDMPATGGGAGKVDWTDYAPDARHARIDYPRLPRLQQQQRKSLVQALLKRGAI